MSSPTVAAPSAPTNDETKDVEVDAEMEDITQDAITSNAPGATNDRSSTVDNDTATLTADPTQTQTQSTLPTQSRKDVTLREFLSKMDDYAPIIPDAVTAHYLTLAGLPPPSAADPSGASTGTTPLPLARLLALATQKFVADIAADAYQYSRIRANNTSAASNALGGAGLPLVPGGAGASAGPGVGVGGPAGGKGGQNAQLGVQRAGFGGGGQGGSGTGKTVLTMEDLGMAVQEYGVNVRRGEFYR